MWIQYSTYMLLQSDAIGVGNEELDVDESDAMDAAQTADGYRQRNRSPKRPFI